jgi:hypothetical protein
MDRRTFIGLAALVAGAALTGCAPLWQVHLQAVPNPFAGQHKFAVLPIDYAGLMVGSKSETQYLSEKDSKQQASFQEDKLALNEKFVGELMAHAKSAGVDVALATGPADAPFLVRPSVRFIEPGFYVGVASAPSRVEMTVQITTPDGKILDELVIVHGTDSRSGFSIGGISLNPSSGGRLRSDGEAMGKIMAKYIGLRVNGE